MLINIKPMSVNAAYRSGPRYKTKEYLAYIEEIMLKLKPMDLPDGNLAIEIDVGFSNKGADLDNVCKPFLDILQKKYGFNDNRIYELVLGKNIVNKGEEYIYFTIKGLDDD